MMDLLDLSVVDAISGVVAIGMVSGCLVVLTAGALVSGFKALLRVIGR